MADFIDKLGFIQIRNRKVMLSWEKGKTAWILPGGKREKGESDIDALARELKEELSIDLIKESARYFNTYQGQAHGKGEGVLVRIICYTGKYSGEIKLNPPVKKLGWVDSKEEKLSIPGKILIADLKDKNLID